MIWDEIDSGHDFLAYTRVSKMLHGGGATEYFQHTQVSVKLMPRKSATPQVRLFDASEQYAHIQACSITCDFVSRILAQLTHTHIGSL